MKDHYITGEELAGFATFLRHKERAEGTVEKYVRDVGSFLAWINPKTVTMEAVSRWKEHLLAEGYAPVSVNAMLAALNTFFRFMGWGECHVSFVKLQHRLFREPGRELSKEEYERLLATAQTQGRERLALVMETICATGIRVSEVKYITVESLRQGRTDISLKGKTRTILLPGKLCRKLEKYAKRQKIASGEIFLTRGGKSLSRRQIWAEMKSLCDRAGISREKVFPHNLRHLFATVFYRVYKDITRLADVLGHSNIETTRIYLRTSGEEHRRLLERLQFVT